MLALHEVEEVAECGLLIEIHVVEDFSNLRLVELVNTFNLGCVNLQLLLLNLRVEQIGLTGKQDTLRL